MTTWDVEHCELCGVIGTDVAPLVDCEGARVCTGCVQTQGSKLAQYRDELREDLDG